MTLAAGPDLQSTESKEILFYRISLVPVGESWWHLILQQQVPSSANAFSSCSTHASRASAGKDHIGGAFPSLILPPEGKAFTLPQALRCLKWTTTYKWPSPAFRCLLKLTLTLQGRLCLYFILDFGNIMFLKHTDASRRSLLRAHIHFCAQ